MAVERLRCHDGRRTTTGIILILNVCVNAQKVNEGSAAIVALDRRRYVVRGVAETWPPHMTSGGNPIFSRPFRRVSTPPIWRIQNVDISGLSSGWGFTAANSSRQRTFPLLLSTPTLPVWHIACIAYIHGGVLRTTTLAARIRAAGGWDWQVRASAWAGWDAEARR